MSIKGRHFLLAAGLLRLRWPSTAAEGAVTVVGVAAAGMAAAAAATAQVAAVAVQSVPGTSAAA
jgi:hypothetical protein